VGGPTGGGSPRLSYVLGVLLAPCAAALGVAVAAGVMNPVGSRANVRARRRRERALAPRGALRGRRDLGGLRGVAAATLAVGGTAGQPAVRGAAVAPASVPRKLVERPRLATLRTALRGGGRAHRCRRTFRGRMPSRAASTSATCAALVSASSASHSSFVYGPRRSRGEIGR